VIQYKRKDGVALSGTYICLQVTIKQKRKIAFINLGLPAELKTKTQRAKQPKLMNSLSLIMDHLFIG
jgi:hypothetical protein